MENPCIVFSVNVIIKTETTESFDAETHILEFDLVISLYNYIKYS